MLSIENVSFRYAGDAGDNGLNEINLTVGAGEIVLLCGPSGCGKTSVTRLVNGLIPHFFEGEFSGSVKLYEKSLVEMSLAETAQIVGSVFQNPRSQFFTVDTDGELAFGCENFGLAVDIIEARRSRTVAEMRLESLLGRSMFELSGGEKQQIACGSAAMLEPDIFVLDEPSSNLDMEAVDRLRSQILAWKKKGKTILIAEHRIHYLYGLTDRIVYMKEGRIVREFHPDELKHTSSGEIHKLGLRAFSPAQLEADSFQYQEKQRKEQLHEEMILRSFSFAYKRKESQLDISELSLPADGIIAVTGKNGAGKSTFMRCLCGLERRAQGSLEHKREKLSYKKRLSNVFLVMQDVNHQLFTESVMDEILLSMQEQNQEQARKIAAQLGVEDLLQRHPMSLSGGQKQRVAIASAVSSQRPILLFDEPTSGLDLVSMRRTARIMKWLNTIGKMVIVVTHDPEFIAECCTHLIKIESGKVVESYPLLSI